MSHVDEGRIHAYLDGAFGPDDPEHAAIEAHLAACARCRATLEGERSIRERAADVLGQVVPDAVRVEPFEKILAARRSAGAGSGAGGGRAAGGPGGGRDGTRRPGRSFYMPMTLAATLVLAVTATWFARAYLPSGGGAPAAVSQDDVRDEDARQAAGAAVPEAEVAQPGRNEQAAVDRLEVREGVASTAAAPPTAQEEAGRAAEAKVAAQAPVPVAAVPPPAAPAEPRRTAAENRRLADSMLARPAQLTEISAAVVGELVAVGGREADMAKALRARSAVNETVAWTTVTVEEATRRLGVAPLAIEGLAPDSMLISDAAGVPIVLTVHHAAGEQVELFQWLAGALITQESQLRRDMPGAERELADVTVAAVRAFRLGAVEFLLRASLPADSLGALAGRVR